MLENPRDEVSWTRVLLLLPGIGDVSARAAIDALARAAWDPDALEYWTPPARARDAFARLVRLLDDLRHPPAGAEPRTVSAEIALLRRVYDDILRDAYDRPEPRLADLDQLEIIAGKFPSRAAFLSELALEPPSATQDLAGAEDTNDDALILSTAHSAKGREWDVVFVIWVVDGWFPSSRALRSDEETEEERRLMYVALTRARDHLYAVYPLNVYGSRYGADYSLDQLSRFFDVGVRERMRRTAAYPAPAGSAADSSGDLQRVVDLRALLRGKFGG